MALARKTPRTERRGRSQERKVDRSTNGRRKKDVVGRTSAPGRSGRGKNGVSRAPARKRRQRDELSSDPDDWLSINSEDLLVHYLRFRRDDVREALVKRHLADVVDTARCLSARLPRSVDIDDLCNAGYSGLLRSIETFDAEKGRSFQSYLRTRVYGSMVDELRAMDWLPRLMRSRLARRDEVVESKRQELGRDPSEEEISQGLGVTLEQYRRSYPTVAPTLAAGLVSGTEQELDRLDANIVGLGIHGKGATEEAHPLTSMYQRELMARIQDLLTTTEWRLVELHYFRGLKLREVAKKLKLSPARICQIHGRVLQRLKERLREEAPTI